MNRKAFIRKFSVGVFASAMLVDALMRDIFAYAEPEPKFGENGWNVMLVSKHRPNRLYKTVGEAMDKISYEEKDSVIYL